MAIFKTIWQKLPFGISKIGKMSKITEISKVSQRHEVFHIVIFTVDFGYNLRIDKNYAILPVSAILATFSRTYSINLKLPKFKGRHFEQKSRKWQYYWSFSQNCHLKSQKFCTLTLERQFVNVWHFFHLRPKKIENFWFLGHDVLA